MKYIKKFESYSVNEEFGGLGILACVGAVFAVGAIYDGIKKGYSKYITGNKYDKTGEDVTIDIDATHKQVIYGYEDDNENKYWGWDHQYNPESGNHYASIETGTMPTGDVYTGIFRYEDLEKLKQFINDFPNYSVRPKPVDFIYVKNIDSIIGAGNY